MTQESRRRCGKREWEGSHMNEGDDYLSVDKINAWSARKMLLWLLCFCVAYMVQEKVSVTLLKNHFSFVLTLHCFVKPPHLHWSSVFTIAESRPTFASTFHHTAVPCITWYLTSHLKNIHHSKISRENPYMCACVCMVISHYKEYRCKGLADNTR